MNFADEYAALTNAMLTEKGAFLRIRKNVNQIINGLYFEGYHMTIKKLITQWPSINKNVRCKKKKKKQKLTLEIL